MIYSLNFREKGSDLIYNPHQKTKEAVLKRNSKNERVESKFRSWISFFSKENKSSFFKQNQYHTKRIKLRLFCYTINKTRQDKARFNEWIIDFRLVRVSRAIWKSKPLSQLVSLSSLRNKLCDVILLNEVTWRLRNLLV